MTLFLAVLQFSSVKSKPFAPALKNPRQIYTKSDTGGFKSVEGVFVLETSVLGTSVLGAPLMEAYNKEKGIPTMFDRLCCQTT